MFFSYYSFTGVNLVYQFGGAITFIGFACNDEILQEFGLKGDIIKLCAHFSLDDRK